MKPGYSLPLTLLPRRAGPGEKFINSELASTRLFGVRGYGWRQIAVLNGVDNGGPAVILDAEFTFIHDLKLFIGTPSVSDTPETRIGALEHWETVADA